MCLNPDRRNHNKRTRCDSHSHPQCIKLANVKGYGVGSGERAGRYILTSARPENRRCLKIFVMEAHQQGRAQCNAMRLRPLLLLVMGHAATADMLGFNFSPRTDPTQVQVLVRRPSAPLPNHSPSLRRRAASSGFPTCTTYAAAGLVDHPQPADVCNPQQPGMGLGQIFSSHQPPSSRWRPTARP